MAGKKEAAAKPAVATAKASKPQVKTDAIVNKYDSAQSSFSDGKGAANEPLMPLSGEQNLNKDDSCGSKASAAETPQKTAALQLTATKIASSDEKVEALDASSLKPDKSEMAAKKLEGAQKAASSAKDKSSGTAAGSGSKSNRKLESENVDSDKAPAPTTKILVDNAKAARGGNLTKTAVVAPSAANDLSLATKISIKTNTDILPPSKKAKTSESSSIITSNHPPKKAVQLKSTAGNTTNPVAKGLALPVVVKNKKPYVQMKEPPKLQKIGPQTAKIGTSTTSTTTKSQIPVAVAAAASPVTPVETSFAITSQIDNIPQNILKLLQTYGPLTVNEISFNIPSTNLSVSSILKIMTVLNVVHYKNGFYYCFDGEVRSDCDTIYPSEILHLIKDTNDEIQESMDRIELLKAELKREVKIGTRTKSVREFLKGLAAKYDGERGIRGDPVYAAALKTLNVDLSQKRKAAAADGNKRKRSRKAAKKKKVEGQEGQNKAEKSVDVKKPEKLSVDKEKGEVQKEGIANDGTKKEQTSSKKEQETSIPKGEAVSKTAKLNIQKEVPKTSKAPIAADKIPAKSAPPITESKIATPAKENEVSKKIVSVKASVTPVAPIAKDTQKAKPTIPAASKSAKIENLPAGNKD